MLKLSYITLILSLLVLALGCGAYAARVTGEVTEVNGKTIVATFNTPIQVHSVMIILTGEGEAVAGMATCRKCEGSGPYKVIGDIEFVSDAEAMTVGKSVYVNSANAGGIPAVYRPQTSANATATTYTAQAGSKRPAHPANLNLYYYAAGQTVGYGALGIGYEKTLRLTKGVGLDLDGGVAGIGNVNAENADAIDNEQLITSLNGRLRMNLATGFGVYTGYRWSQGQGDEQRWSSLSEKIQYNNFIAASTHDAGTVLTQGIEYGLAFQPGHKFGLLVGYIPALRTDFGSYGVCSMPAYTAELRFGVNKGALRLRGIRSEDYWLADLGITIK